jgi:hypothetical protein
LSTLHTLDRGGDTRLEWTSPTERAEAEETFRRLHDEKKYRAVAIKNGEREIIHRFDPDADRIVLSPQTVGG